MCQTPQTVWPRGSGGQVPGSLPCSPNMHMAQSQELEAASRSSETETYLAENGGGRPASVQPRSCIRVQEGTGQNYLSGKATSPTSPEWWWWWWCDWMTVNDSVCRPPTLRPRTRSNTAPGLRAAGGGSGSSGAWRAASTVLRCLTSHIHTLTVITAPDSVTLFMSLGFYTGLRM